MILDISIITTKKYILISIEFSQNHNPTFLELFRIKNQHYPHLVFIEIHPTESKLVNNANVRHLYHLKDKSLPCLTELELIKDFSKVK